jgi:hypothetical protein
VFVLAALFSTDSKVEFEIFTSLLINRGSHFYPSSTFIMFTVFNHFFPIHDDSFQQALAGFNRTLLLSPCPGENHVESKSMPKSNDTSDEQVSTGGTGRFSNPDVITTLKQTDILLGRGAFCISHIGNILFREFCYQRRNEYNATISRIAKSRIAIEIMEAIYAEGGQFLRPATSEEMQRAGLLEQSTRGWMLITNRTAILSKIKQTVRTKEDISRHRGNAASPHVHEEETEPGDDNNVETVDPMALAMHRDNLTQLGDISSNHGQIDDKYEDWNLPKASEDGNARLDQSFPSQDEKVHHQETTGSSVIKPIIAAEYGQNDTVSTYYLGSSDRNTDTTGRSTRTLTCAKATGRTRSTRPDPVESIESDELREQHYMK